MQGAPLPTADDQKSWLLRLSARVRQLPRSLRLSVRHKTRSVLGSQPGEPLPRRWIAWTFLMGAMGFVWGWYLGSWGFVQNILASLVLVGPGLIVTNVLVVKWQRRRAADEVLLALAATTQVLGPVCGLVASMARTVSPRVPAEYRLPEFDRDVSLDELLKLLGASEYLLMLGPFGDDLEPGSYLASGLELPPAHLATLSRQVRSALLRLSAKREFPQVMFDGEELIEALDAPLLCQITPNSSEGLDAEFHVVDAEVSNRTPYGLRDVRHGDVVITERRQLIQWTAAILYPLRNLLSEISLRRNYANRGIIDDNFTPFTLFRLDVRFIHRPRSWPTEDGSADA